MPFAIGGRRVLADAEVEVAPAAALGLEVAGAVERRGSSSSTATRSAEPPTSHGIALGERVRAPVPTSRGSRYPFASAGNVGSADSQPSGRSRRWMRSISSASSGYSARYFSNIVSQASRASSTASPMPGGEVLVHAVGDEEVLRPRASRRTASWPCTPSTPNGSPCALGESSTGEP